MSKHRTQVFAAIESERAYQETRWGSTFDDKNTINDWSAYITRYLGNATFEKRPLDQRIQLVKVAALAVAALEAFDRNTGFPTRHYDE